MLKVAIGMAGMAALMASVPAYARGQDVENDMARCADPAGGPAVLVDVRGFKAATGRLRVQSYRATPDAWLAKGAWLARVDTPVRVTNNAMRVCLPLPQPGRFGIAVRHDRDGNGKTDISKDGGGFSNNPAISIFNLGKPSVDKAAFQAGPGVTRITITLKYM